MPCPVTSMNVISMHRHVVGSNRIQHHTKDRLHLVITQSSTHIHSNDYEVQTVEYRTDTFSVHAWYECGKITALRNEMKCRAWLSLTSACLIEGQGLICSPSFVLALFIGMGIYCVSWWLTDAIARSDYTLLVCLPTDSPIDYIESPEHTMCYYSVYLQNHFSW